MLRGLLFGIAVATLAGHGAPAEQRPADEVLALVNEARARHGAPPLRPDRRLARAAARHARDMVARRYFAHESWSGARFSRRIARAGWMRGRGRWHVGEALAWGADDAGTPSAIVAAWLRSPPHRRVLLARRYHVAGIAVAAGTPFGDDSRGLTYTADLGS